MSLWAYLLTLHKICLPKEVAHCQLPCSSSLIAIMTTVVVFFVISNSNIMSLSGPYMTESLNAFVIGHWSVSRQISSRHFLLSNNENLIFVEHVPSQCASAQPLPVQAYTWLVKHLSREGDTVVDVESDTGYPVVASLRQGRSAVWLNTASRHKEAEKNCQPCICRNLEGQQ